MFLLGGGWWMKEQAWEINSKTEAISIRLGDTDQTWGCNQQNQVSIHRLCLVISFYIPINDGEIMSHIQCFLGYWTA